MIEIPKDELERLARSRRSANDGIKLGDDEYYWLEPAESTNLRAAIAAIAKPPEGRTQADSLKDLLLLLRELGIGNASGPVRKLAMDAAPAGNRSWPPTHPPPEHPRAGTHQAVN